MKGETIEFELDFMVGKVFDRIYRTKEPQTYYVTEFFDFDGTCVHDRGAGGHFYDYKNHVYCQDFSNLPKYDYCSRTEHITVYNESVVFKNEEETVYFSHEQECCENVCFESIDIPLESLQGHKIISAKCRTVIKYDGDGEHSDIWYIFEVEGVGTATMRWAGESNGYYSTAVDVYYQDDREYNKWCRKVN